MSSFAGTIPSITMGGHHTNVVAITLRGAIVCACLAAVVSAGPAPAAEPAGGCTLRVTWGGGKPAARVGSIEVASPDGAQAIPAWRILSDDPLAPATMHRGEKAIEIHEPRGLDMNGVDLVVADWRTRVKVTLARVEAASEPVVLEAAVADLVATSETRQLDRDGNRLSVGRAPGDELRVAFAAGESAIRRPGESMPLTVQPLVPARVATGSAYELKVRTRRSGAATDAHAQAVAVEEAGVEVPGMRAFRPVRVAVPLPAEEGGCDVELELVERGGLGWSRPVATRTVQVVAVAAERPRLPAADWKVVYELDPGSPKLLERLRRLPGMGLPSLPMTGVPLPKLPRPSFSLPKVAIPTPSLPAVPLPSNPLAGVPVPKMPSVSAMVPRLTGLLAVGHSTLDSHELGPMLRLPPAEDEPVWEGVALPAGVPGQPHLVEVEYPLEQEMTLGLAVLEEHDGDVRATATSGVDLPAPLVDDGARRGRLGTRRFVYWPRTRSPLLVVANLSSHRAAVFGRVRVLTGPMRVADREPPSTAARRTYLHIPTPDFSPFGAVGRATAGGRTTLDWDAFLGGIGRSADWALAQNAAGSLVGVYARGAAIWPTTLTNAAPRWDSGGGFDGRLDPESKDVLGLVCRLYAREGLRLVPAITCDGPLPALDGEIARGGAAAEGIVAVGRDGAAMVTDGGCPHYNILDRRVQAAVEAVVAELVGRLGDAAAVDGIAVLVPHDGWLHLPGVAAALDDATFARFAAAAGAEAEPLVRPAAAAGDPRRFAARAALVEGPLRDRWLAWREAEVAAFYGRLAAAVTAGGSGRKLVVMPTTLFVAGPFAARFRPQLPAAARDAEVLREVGLDPGRITAHAGVVYVAPHVHVAADRGGEAGAASQANRSLAMLRGTARAARMGVLLLEQPGSIDLRDVAAQASFTAKPSGAVAVATPAGSGEAGRALAEAVLAGDPEMIFDAGLLHACLDEADERSRLAVSGLPPVPLETVPTVPAPLVVRMREGEAGLWVSVVNACGTPCRATLNTARRPTAVADVVSKATLPIGPDGEIALPLSPWEARTVVLEGGERITQVRSEYPPDVAAAVKTLVRDLERRRQALEMPAPLPVLDNPSFDLPELGGLVPGWELVEPGRGRLARVSGKPSAGGAGLSFASEHGLATLRSNPFAAPATGRISVAVWLRAGGPDTQPPLRIAIEGLRDGREFYRFAAVGRGSGAMPLSAAWSQFVLQIDDLPTRGLESLRVRLDLLGPGAVEIDDVRVFDLAFDESQRVQLSRIIAVAAERAAGGDVGGCLLELDGPWPRFLRTHVAAAGDTAAEAGPGQDPDARSGVLDRVRRWWQ